MILASLLSLVELNCENLFDCRHDSLKNDTEFLPDGTYRWTPQRYWRKLDNIGRTILACGSGGASAYCLAGPASQAGGNGREGAGWQWRLPDLVALCEVENDSVMRDLTRRSLLRKACYEYVVTNSADLRGIDVALLYSPLTFRLVNSRAVSVERVGGMRPTRDVLYASGVVPGGDTLHVMVVHFPSRRGGERLSRPYRMAAARTVAQLADSVRALSPGASILVAGDFNDYSASPSLKMLADSGLADISAGAVGANGALGTYRYQGQWASLDHILASPPMAARLLSCRVFDAPFLLAPDERYGGVKPRRNYVGPRYMDGFSDHLPLVATFCLDMEPHP